MSLWINVSSLNENNENEKYVVYILIYVYIFDRVHLPSSCSRANCAHSCAPHSQSRGAANADAIATNEGQESVEKRERVASLTGTELCAAWRNLGQVTSGNQIGIIGMDHCCCGDGDDAAAIH